jgi:hypothetical protein
VRNSAKYWALGLGLGMAVGFGTAGEATMAGFTLALFGGLAASLAAAQADREQARREIAASLPGEAWSSGEDSLALARAAIEKAQKEAVQRAEAETQTSWGELAKVAGVKGFAPFARLGDGWVCEFAVKDGVAYEFEGVGGPEMAKPGEGLWICGLVYAKASNQKAWLERARALKPIGEENDLPLGQPIGSGA